MKNQKGITLIALVITIIVLLILAGVTLNLVAGGDGILRKATNAVNETNKAKVTEEIELALAELKTEYYEEKYSKRTTTQNFAEYATTKLKSKDAGDNLVGIATSNGKLTLNGSDLIYEGKDGTNAIGEFDDKTGSVTIEGITINGEKLPTIPEGFEIGTVVSYAPNGTYNWQAKYASSDLATDGTADITLASGTSLTEGNTDMSITEWKVFDVNKLTGEIKLVPSKPNTNKVRLQGANGYNNAVKLLNEACSSLYGKEGVTARSINIEDIESVLQYDPKTWVNDSVNVSYNQQYTEAYTENKIYPAIYAQEKDSVITPAPTGISKTLGRSDSAREWITGTMSAETSIKPYQTYYHVWIKSLLESEYVNVLLPSDWATDYWIASHSIFLGENGCVFSVMGIKDGMMDAFDMIRTGGTEFEGACILFPIVSLNIDQIAGDMENGFNVK